MNDGLLLFEFRDAIHEGNHERIIRFWKFLLLYFHSAGHTKYAVEALTLMAMLNGLVSERLKQQIMWGRVVNTRGGLGHNIPIDLQMEHLNRTLKNMVLGIGTNITESTIVNASRSLNGIVAMCNSFDKQLGIAHDSIHHSRKSCEADRAIVIKQLATDSRVFHYTPGRQHRCFKGISPNISLSVKIDTLFKSITKHKKRISNKQKFMRYLKIRNLTQFIFTLYTVCDLMILNNSLQ